MTDLEEALCNPLLVADERFDLTRKAAAEIKRHMREKVELAGLVAKERAEIGRLEAALDKILSLNGSSAWEDFEAAQNIARAARAGKVQP